MEVRGMWNNDPNPTVCFLSVEKTECLERKGGQNTNCVISFFFSFSDGLWAHHHVWSCCDRAFQSKRPPGDDLQGRQCGVPRWRHRGHCQVSPRYLLLLVISRWSTCSPTFIAVLADFPRMTDLKWQRSEFHLLLSVLTTASLRRRSPLGRGKKRSMHITKPLASLRFRQSPLSTAPRHEQVRAVNLPLGHVTLFVLQAWDGGSQISVRVVLLWAGSTIKAFVSEVGTKKKVFIWGSGPKSSNILWQDAEMFLFLPPHPPSLKFLPV